jgi:hypothetical protein
LLLAMRALEHRMDRMNRVPQGVASELTELTADGVIFWHLSFAEQSDLWCLVFELSDGFHLVLDDDPLGTAAYTLSEQHVDIAAVVNRADRLKGSLLHCGWKEIDVE